MNNFLSRGICNDITHMTFHNLITWNVCNQITWFTSCHEMSFTWLILCTEMSVWAHSTFSKVVIVALSNPKIWILALSKHEIILSFIPGPGFYPHAIYILSRKIEFYPIIPAKIEFYPIILAKIEFYPFIRKVLLVKSVIRLHDLFLVTKGLYSNYIT